MSSLLRVTVLLWLVVATAFAARPFAQESSDLPADPAARFGTLPNGVRYVIRANAEPKGRAALRFVVLAGSFMETERERGIAHYLEHMSFNGSTHYAPGTLVEFFQRLGMNFGGDTNAYTSFDRTVYMIDLPDTKAETLAEGFRVFSDYAGGLLLEQKSVEKERPIILAEMRTRDTVQYRMMMAMLGFALPDTLLSQRMPIGTKEVIEQVQRDDFVHFYDTWYRPERIAVVAVGDFDPAQVEKQLTEAMAAVKDRAPALPEPNPGSLTKFEGVRTFAHFEREAPATTVTIMALSPYSKEADTSVNRLKYLPRGLALAMLNRRIAILAKEEGVPFLGGQASVQEVLDFYREASIELMCKPEQWQAALGVAEHELRRALEHGFQKAELAEAVANMREGLEKAVKTASTRRSPELAQAISDSVADDNVFTTPETELELYGPKLAE
ncbi:MAG TPA: insulinase family protein, partial [Opitutaceae bacterium]|nr:insulinase family protein [Opitutaceae bacterium]